MNLAGTMGNQKQQSEKEKEYMRSNTIQRISCAGMAAMLLILAGCESMTSPKDERSEGRALDDKHITSSVERSLETEPTYKFPEVSVTTFAGVVQLSGFVNSDGQRARAAEIAQNTDGVKQVVNGIALKPMLPATGQAPVQRIYADPNNPNAPASTDSNQNAMPPK